MPPVGLLYLAAVIRQAFAGDCCVKLYDTGIAGLAEDRLRAELATFQPDIVGFSSLSCEADVLHRLAQTVKNCRPDIVTVAGGPHTMVAQEALLEDSNLDFAVLGEGERTVTELLTALAHGSPITEVNGLICRSHGTPRLTPERAYIPRLDELPFPAWDLVDFKAYARYPNWNGSLQEPLYAPLVSSRGCPFHCAYCHSIFGKQVRARSPENILAEIKWLHDTYNIREFHFLDDIFNFNPLRTLKIAELIIASGLKVSLAFPNGLRADLLTPEVLSALRQAGTYKINYGIETPNLRLQNLIKKELNLPKTVEMIHITSQLGIIASGYFMLGLPGETRDEIMETINWAVDSELDNAYFFKATLYPGSELYRTQPRESTPPSEDNFTDYHFYSASRSEAAVSAAELNGLILQAQQKFFLKFNRLWRLWMKSRHKLRFCKNLAQSLALLLQSYILIKALGKVKPESRG